MLCHTECYVTNVTEHKSTVRYSEYTTSPSVQALVPEEHRDCYTGAKGVWRVDLSPWGFPARMGGTAAVFSVQ